MKPASHELFEQVAKRFKITPELERGGLAGKNLRSNFVLALGEKF